MKEWMNRTLCESCIYTPQIGIKPHTTSRMNYNDKFHVQIVTKLVEFTDLIGPRLNKL